MKSDNGTPSDTSDDYVVAPNQLALGGCSAKISSSDQVVASAWIRFDATAAPGNSDIWGRPVLIHGGQTNVFFLDGHAESFTKDGLSQKYFTYVTNATSREARRVGSSGSWTLDPDAD